MVIDVVVSFSWCKGFGKVSTGVMVSIGISLHKYSSCSKEEGIGHESEGVGDVRDEEDWGRGEYLFECVKGVLLQSRSDPGFVLSSEEIEGGDNV